jgi:chromosome partitioning protein
MRALFQNKLRKLVTPRNRYHHGTRSATVISVATVKGGVGKTTTAVNLACGLAGRGSRTLLIDLDAQGHCTHALSSSIKSTRSIVSLSQALLGNEGRELLDVRVDSGVQNLDITPPDPSLAEAEGRISQKIGKELLLRDALRMTKTHYDYVIIDCPPNKGNLTLNALLASDQVIIPSDLSPLAVHGADELLQTILTVNNRLGHSVDLLGIVITRYDGRNGTVNRAMEGQIAKAWGDCLFQTRIGTNTKLAAAQLSGRSIFEHAPSSRGAKHYEALTEEVIQRLGRGIARA